ncbi:CHAT domain-containing protein [Aspergillus udagawae]|nr:CHAT domain-containing protein [Aspergillus udagawae]
MPLLNIGNTRPSQKETDQLTEFYLICFDKYGVERREAGALLSVQIRDLLAKSYKSEDPYTDVFILSHGWKGDVPAAKISYSKWIRAMVEAKADCEKVAQQIQDFKPLIIGLHWPSLPFGDENLEDTHSWLLSSDNKIFIEKGVDTFAQTISDTMAARESLQTIIKTAQEMEESDDIPDQVLDAYRTLFTESDLVTDDLIESSPFVEQGGFDPAVILREAKEKQNASAEELPETLLGLRDLAKSMSDVILAPLRQLSFWRMKKRARIFGQTGANQLLRDFQSVAPMTRFHLMGHSFGCIVVSGMIAGLPNGRSPAKPVQSLFLVQGALSLWSYADWIPAFENIPGYFNFIIRERLVRGPILVTTSKADKALDFYYPCGVRIYGSQLLGSDEGNEGKSTAYGALGIYGLRGLKGIQEVTMVPEGQGTQSYDFEPGNVYNINADAVIKGGDGLSGAHNDIAHREVAHAFWASVLTGVSVTYEEEDEKEGPSKAPSRVVRLEPEGGSMLLSAEPGPLSEKTATILGHELEQSSSTVTGISPPQRYIRSRIIGQDENRPVLIPERIYEFAINVQAEMPRTGLSIPFDDASLFPNGTSEVVLTIYLESNDFHVYKCKEFLRIPRRGPSLNTASFGISPRRKGKSRLQIIILVNFNFVQHIEYSFDVGAKPSVDVAAESNGKLSSTELRSPRDMTILIRPVSDGGYECIIISSQGVLKGLLKVSRQELARLINAAAKSISELFEFKRDGISIFKSIHLKQEDKEHALRFLAEVGHDLFKQIFYSNSSDTNTDKIADYLCKELNGSRTYKIQVVAENAPIPWGILYARKETEKPSWDYFIGMRHMLEQKSLRNPDILLDMSSTIHSSPKLFVGANLTTEKVFGDYVDHQHNWWMARASDDSIEYTPRQDDAVLRELKNPNTKDHIFYFYCHCAQSFDPQSGPEASFLRLNKQQKITLKDLNRINVDTYQSHPLVFINACGSARMSPLIYDSFVPYFMKRGARGVIGTEYPIPGEFAQYWAEGFFDRLLNGEALGEAFFNLRQDIWKEHNNPFGLFYAIYCDGDTHIRPAPVGVRVGTQGKG